MTNDKLPEEMQEQVCNESAQYLKKLIADKRDPCCYAVTDYIAGATAWAGWKVRFDELAIENENLRRWKMEAAELLTKIHSYAHKHLEIKLGASTVEFVISMAKERDALKDKHDTLATVLQEFVSNHEAGLLPNRFVYDKAIKILNDGL